jgi:hypothetical protein
MFNKKRSFFDRLTGSTRDEEEMEEKNIKGDARGNVGVDKKNGNTWMEEENE